MLNVDDLLAKIAVLEDAAARIAEREKHPEKNAFVSLPDKNGNQVRLNPYLVARGTVLSIFAYEHMRVKDHWIDCDGELYTTEELCCKIHDSWGNVTLIHVG